MFRIRLDIILVSVSGAKQIGIYLFILLLFRFFRTRDGRTMLPKRSEKHLAIAFLENETLILVSA